MAVRVSAGVAALLLLASPVLAGYPPRAGISEALLGRWERAYDRLSASAQPDRAERFFLARALVQLGLREQALATLSELARTPGSFGGPALEAAVNALFEAGRYGDAASLAGQGRDERFQDEPRYRYQVGQSLWLEGRAAEARIQLERVRSGPFLPYALHTLAQIARTEGRLQDAAEILGKAIDAALSHPDSGVARFLADRIRLSRGRLVYETAVGARGLTEADRRRLLEAARAQFARIASDSPFYPDALRGTGWCALELGASADALTAFEGAAGLDPEKRDEDQWAQGRAYQRLGYFDEAARLYAEAQKSARARARRVAAQESKTASADHPWQEMLGAAERTASRLQELGGEAAAVASSASQRSRRAAASFGGVGSLAERAQRLEAELAELEAGLDGYVDALSAPSLFPKQERPRMEALLTRQDRVGREIATLETALERLTASGVWKGAGEAQRRAAEVLWERVGSVKAGLSRAQLAFLEGIKSRVSNRDVELRQLVKARGEDLKGLSALFEGARSRLGGEQRRLESLAKSLGELDRRREALGERLAALTAQANRAREAALAAIGEEAARRVLLRADAYALDETEALHLWEERGERRGEGGRP